MEISQQTPASPPPHDSDETAQLLENGLIGVSSGPIPLEGQAEFARAVLQLCAQASRDIRIYSRDLDAALYDRPELLEALKRIALDRRDLCIRILIEDSSRPRKQDHRLIALIRRLPSRFALRKPPPEQSDRPTSYLIADLTGIVYRGHPKNYQGYADYYDRRGADRLNKEFMEIWEQSEPERELRILDL
jgi:hypothetical protein